MKTGLTTRVIEGQSARLELETAEIRVTAGPDRGVAHKLDGGPIVIGSSSECDLVLHDPSVSARHAEITTAAGGYILRDLHSTNGVFLGAYRVGHVVLGDRMRLKLGESSLQVRALGETVSVPLERAGELGPLVAHSVKMRAFVAQLRQAAPSDATVLIQGETGTGKEVAAETLHALSDRRRGPFVVFDCGAVSRSLASAALFGYERGAFTGAVSSRPGVFEQAAGGTLFLDEVGEIPLDVQPMLLAALERRSSRRLGGAEPIAYDVRVVAATNRNLAEEVRAGRFRQDLYYRLAVVRLRLPPLRERPEDFPVLAARFAEDFDVSLAPDVVVSLASHHWPGNLRELRNTVQRISIGPGEEPVYWHDASLEHPAAAASGEDPMFDERGGVRALRDARRDLIERFERRYVHHLLEQTQGNLAGAAAVAGMTRQAMTVLANKLGLNPHKTR